VDRARGRDPGGLAVGLFVVFLFAAITAAALLMR
jgi:hypothetical protein